MSTAGEIRTRDRLSSQESALSAELQRYASENLDLITTRKSIFSDAVDNFGVMVMKLQSRGCSCYIFRVESELRS